MHSISDAFADMKTDTLTMRIDPKVKLKAQETLEPLGLSIAQAVDIFLRKVAAVGGIPFDVRQPRYSLPVESFASTPSKGKTRLKRQNFRPLVGLAI
jgi:DNA-damage-inducible protein J